MSVCKNCKYYNACGFNKRTMECKGKELKLNLQLFGGRGASSSNKITTGNYKYTERGADLSIKVLDVNGNKILARISGKGSNGSFFDGVPREIQTNSPVAKGMVKS